MIFPLIFKLPKGAQPHNFIVCSVGVWGTFPNKQMQGVYNLALLATILSLKTGIKKNTMNFHLSIVSFLSVFTFFRAFAVANNIS